MDNLIKYGYQFSIILLFILVFFGLLASPMIYINSKQKQYFKKLSEQFNLNLDSGKNIFKRNLPRVYGNYNNTPVYFQASILGNYSYNTQYNTQKYASPVVVIGMKLKNLEIKRLKIIQKEELKTQFPSNFNTYFDFDIEYKEKTEKIHLSDIKQKIIFYTKKHPYFNVELKNGYLISIANYELKNETNYLNLLEQFSMIEFINNAL